MQKYPYQLLVTFTDGRSKVIAESHNPREARAAESRVSRNPKVIERIQLWDLTGPLDTIWCASWD